jgi:chemotaxis protein CheC
MDDKAALYADTLKEICNMGSGSAAARLSKMINKKVEAFVPEAYITNVQPDASEVIKEDGAMVIFEAEFFSEEKEKGKVYLFFNSESVMELIDGIMGSAICDEEMEESVIIEVGNIVASSIITAIANFLEKKVLLSPPKMAVEAPEAVVDSAIAEQFEETGCALFAHALIGVEGSSISMQMFLFPHFDLVKEIWRKARLSTSE